VCVPPCGTGRLADVARRDATSDVAPYLSTAMFTVIIATFVEVFHA